METPPRPPTGQVTALQM